MKIAIIILNYNSVADCRKCIGFLKQQEGVETEIVVVDNCSPHQGEQETIKQLCTEKGCTFIQANENRGYNAGNNIGLRYAVEKGYKYALIANPDMEFPQTDYLKRMVEAMEHDEEIVTCGSDIVTPEGKHQNPMKRDGDWTSSFGWIGSLLRRQKDADTYDFIDNYQASHRCFKLSGCCLMVNLRLLSKIGLFDEYPFLFCEEAIFAKQAETENMKMFYIADIQAVHRHIVLMKGDSRPRFRQWLRSRLYFTRRYSGYPWYGRMLASLSWRSYIGILIMISTVKRFK